MDKIRVVTFREFITQLKRPSFWWLTFGMPLLIALGVLLMFGIMAVVIATRDSKETVGSKVIGIVDHAGVVHIDALNHGEARQPFDAAEFKQKLSGFKIHPSLVDTIVKFSEKRNGPTDREDGYRLYADRETAVLALEAEAINSFLIVPEDFRECFVAEFVQKNESEDRISVRSVERHIRNMLIDEVAEEPLASHLIYPLEELNRTYLEPKTVDDEESEWTEKIRNYLMPIMLLVLMVMVIFGSTDRLIRGMVEEKQNRVIEVLLSSVTANQLMAGKVFGLGLVGLVQLIIWSLGFIWPLSFAVGILKIGPATLLVFLIFFLLGYFLLATFILSFGSLGNNIQEAGQWSMVWILLALSPMFVLPNIIESPEGVLAQIATYFPLTAPLGVVARMGANAISFGEICLSLLVLIVSLALSIRIGAKVFRIGILMTGKSPNPIELWRAWRQSN